MNITLFGANGRIGKIVMRHALENGDTVTAYVRRRESLDGINGNLIIIDGDLSNRMLIDKAIENADVVISALGPALDASRKLKETPIADGHANIIHSMEKMDKKRFITLGTPAVRSDEDRIRFSTVVPRAMARVFYHRAYREMKIIEQIVKKSSLEWTVVRMINPNVKHKKTGTAFHSVTRRQKWASRARMSARSYTGWHRKGPTSGRCRSYLTNRQDFKRTSGRDRLNAPLPITPRIFALTKIGIVLF